MQINEYVNTPRFLTVRISAIFANADEAREAGYREPTHYDNDVYEIHGKHIGTNRMVFAAILRKQ